MEEMNLIGKQLSKASVEEASIEEASGVHPEHQV